MPRRQILAIILIVILILIIWLTLEVKNLSSVRLTDKLGQILEVNLSEFNQSVQNFKQDINAFLKQPRSIPKLTNEQMERLRERIKQINDYER